MKKCLALLLALAAVVSLAACKAKKNPTDDAATTVKSIHTLPGEDSKLFANVPKPTAELTYTNTGKDNNGYVYQWEFKGMDYDEFKDYVDELKKAEFTYYSTSANAVAAKEPAFKKTAKECGYTASWLGVRSGLYVYLSWYGDEFFEKNNITGPNCRVMFYTYNPFTKAETSTEAASTGAKK